MKKLLILILLFSLTGCSNQVDLGAKKVKVEKLKATKDKILKANTVDDVRCDENDECTNYGKVKQYLYLSDVEVPAKKMKYKGVELTEDISKRTKNSVHFKIINDENLLGATETDTYIAKFYTGDPYYREGENTAWIQTETATSTIDTFDKETATSTISYYYNKIKNKIVNYVLATTESFYAGAGDGLVYYYSTASWDLAHNASTGLGAILTSPATIATRHRSNPRWYNYRGFFPVDTSSIGAGSTITSANMNLYSDDTLVEDNDTEAYIGMVQTTQNSTATLITADYNQCGAVDNPTLGSDDKPRIEDFATGAYESFTLNATGLGWISKTGYTKLGFREGHDIEDLSIASTIKYNYVKPYTSLETGTDKDPYLEVVYTPAAGGERRMMIIN